MISYEVYDPDTGKNVELIKAHEITAHTAAKIPGFSGVVNLTRDSHVCLRIEHGFVVHVWNAKKNLPLAIYEPCKYGGLDRVYTVKLPTLLSGLYSGHYSFH